MTRIPLLGLLSFFLFQAGAGAVYGQAQEVVGFRIEAPELVLAGIPFEVAVEAVDAEGRLVGDYDSSVRIGGLSVREEGRIEAPEAAFDEGRLVISGAVLAETGRKEVTVSAGSLHSSRQIRVIPGILSVLPPLVAIVLALVFRQVVVSLYAGIWLGAIFVFDYDILGGFFRVVDHFLINSMTKTSQVQIIVFSLLFGGMVGIITQNGGARGIAALITRYSRTAMGGQVSTWLMAFFLFFDDYANVLVRGNLMRPITDRLRISREKLAFLVDTGAATVASIFVISTWIGYEVGLIQQGLDMIGSGDSAYTVFVQTIPYRFYPILALILALLIAVTGRDFGPMLVAERRARLEGKLLRDGAEPATDLSSEMAALSEDVSPRWINGVLPVFSILAVAIFGLYWTGTGALAEQGVSQYGIGEIMSEADSYVALLWASLSGCTVALALTLGQRLLGLGRTMDAWVGGLKAMMLAMLILVFAWSLGSVTEELHTADYLVRILKGVLSPYWLPALTFIVAAAVAFATGTSWTTMAIMMPLVIPLAHTLAVESQLAAGPARNILLGVISSVLAGAVFGDHCSPISDTTILSSMSSACDHIDHVRTQLPYALVAAGAGVVLGDIPTAYGLSPWLSILAGGATLAAILFVWGEKVVAVRSNR